MNQSLRAVLAVIVAAAAFGTAISWVPMNTPPNMKVRWISTGVFIAGIAILAWAERRKDLAPDFLGEEHPGFYERDGFCFAVQTALVDGRSMLQVIFQNRYDSPCNARVQIRPLRWRLRLPPVQAVVFPISCPGAAYGVSSIHWPVPPGWEGKKILVSIAASPDYPSGKGTMVRYREGRAVDGISGSWEPGLTEVAAVLTLNPMLTAGKSRMTLTLPKGADNSPHGAPLPGTGILWHPGDDEEEDEDT